MGGGGAIAGVRTLGTAIDDSRKETAESVSRFSNLFSSRDGYTHVKTPSCCFVRAAICAF